MLKSRGIDLATISQLERLAIVGASGMGALTYSPAWNIERDVYKRQAFGLIKHQH